MDCSLHVQGCSSLPTTYHQSLICTLIRGATRQGVAHNIAYNMHTPQEQPALANGG